MTTDQAVAAKTTAVLAAASAFRLREWGQREGIKASVAPEPLALMSEDASIGLSEKNLKARVGDITIPDTTITQETRRL